MLDGLAVLVVDDDGSAASELAFAIEVMGGRLVGPVATVAEGMALLDAERVDAAVVDAHLADRDVTPLALLLKQRRVPFVIHTGSGIPAALAACHSNLPVVMKPARTKVLLSVLLRQWELSTTGQRLAA